MDFEQNVRLLVEEFARQLEAAFRAQLEARMLGDVAPARARVSRAPRAARAPRVQPAAAAPAAPAPAAKAPPTAATPETLMARVVAFVEDNQDRIGEDDKPIRIDRALIAERLAVDPELALAVLDHLVSARKLLRHGARRGGHYTTHRAPAPAPARSKRTVMAEIERQVSEGLSTVDAGSP